MPQVGTRECRGKCGLDGRARTPDCVGDLESARQICRRSRSTAARRSRNRGGAASVGGAGPVGARAVLASGTGVSASPAVRGVLREVDPRHRAVDRAEDALARTAARRTACAVGRFEVPLDAQLIGGAGHAARTASPRVDREGRSHREALVQRGAEEIARLANAVATRKLPRRRAVVRSSRGVGRCIALHRASFEVAGARDEARAGLVASGEREGRDASREDHEDDRAHQRHIAQLMTRLAIRVRYFPFARPTVAARLGTRSGACAARKDA